MKKDTAAIITNALFETFLSRRPDPDGLDYWTYKFMESNDVDSVVEAFLTTSEYLEKRVFYNSNAVEQFTKTLLQNINREINIIDAGSILVDAEQPIWMSLSQYKPLNVVGFDPQVSENISILHNINQIKISNRSFALGDGITRSFYINNEINTSSFYPILPNKGLKHLETLYNCDSKMIETRKLDEVNEFEIVDFFKIDVQGFELDILCHSVDVLKRTGTVYLEVEFNAIYDGQPLWAEIDIFLRSNGFKLVDVFNHRYPYINSLISNSSDMLMWGDALYMKMLPDIESRAVQSLILGEIYQKWNLSETVFNNISGEFLNVQ